MDFNIKQYKYFLDSIRLKDYGFQTFNDFLTNPKVRSVVLRHDVSLLPFNSLKFAKIQNELGIQGTYYFRAVPDSWNESIIKEISELGHEIGYHYENLTTKDGNLKLAIRDFKKNLEKLRHIAPVSTICMYGCPKSIYDSKDIWKKYNYRNYDIIGEPYFDIDFNKVMYLTDTGRMWDGKNVSVRDKVSTNISQSYHTTNQIIEALRLDILPDQIMFAFHPQRWHDNPLLWTKELVLQNTKNIVKKYFFVSSSARI